MAYGCHEERYELPIQAVDTHRPKPNKKGKPAEEAAPTSSASSKRDYFGDTSKVFAAKPEVNTEELKKAQDDSMSPTSVQQGS
jgi:6-phosphofructo-2-kinase/fructose-2,6-biphosphatase 2